VVKEGLTLGVCVPFLSRYGLPATPARHDAKTQGKPMKTILGLVAALCLVLTAGDAPAQSTYPDKTIRILVGFPPGGPPDIAARILAEKFSEAWGKPVVVENATGSGGNLAIERASKAAADGYTLVMASNAIVINPSLYEKLPYDLNALAPISLTVSMPCILVVNTNVPARSVADIVALARAQPGKLSFGHAGIGTPAHLAGELFKVRAGVDVQQVPYRGMPLAVPDLLAGHLSMIFPNVSVVLPLVREGTVRALAITSLKRFDPLPDLPTMDESGFPGFEATAWFGLMAPAETPPAIIEQLNRETARVLAQSNVRARLGELGMEVVANTSAEFAGVIRSETEQWAKLIKEARIKVTE
jgi:tripartite-type tricarboxylate transporter receptor subunit TctC